MTSTTRKKINLFIIVGFLFLVVISQVKTACVVPAKTLPLSTFTFRPSTLQIFTALNLTCSGFVTGWRVVLTAPKPLNRINGVYLAVFRQLTASKFQLMGITEVNQQASTNNKDNAGNSNNHQTPFWEVIPARPQFPVQRGDVLGIFYKRWFISEREVAIPVAGEEHVAPGTPPAYVAMKDWFDVSETLQTGGVLSMSDAGIVRRLPALQAFVNVGICGNSRVEDAEECDDANTADNDGCSALCRNEPISGLSSVGISPDSWNIINVCGNGVTEPPAEDCDDGNRINGDGCSSKCRLEDPGGPTCGNGRQEPGEQCDDGNNHDGDGCSSDCRTEQIAVCGNQVLELGEQCDDGNTANADGCNSRCMLEGLGVCGDYNVDFGEECDDGNTENGDGCSANCTKEICGNGVRDINEECDDANRRNGDGCSSECKLEKCGNGILDPMEQCDDGNRVGGDGCASNCTLEICGNGIKEGAEQCDDGNAELGDGCSAQCFLEICGNGQLDPREECDDGNTISGDGCSNECRAELAAVDNQSAVEQQQRKQQPRQKKRPNATQQIVLPETTTEFVTMMRTTDETSTLSTTTTTTVTRSATTLPTATTSVVFLGIAPALLPMVDFSNYAEGETFALGSAVASSSSSSSIASNNVAESIPNNNNNNNNNDSNNYPITPQQVAVYKARSALRNLEGQLRILPPRQSSATSSSSSRYRNTAYNFPAFTSMRRSPSVKRHQTSSLLSSSYNSLLGSIIHSYLAKRTTTTTTTTTRPKIKVDLNSPTVSPNCLEAPLLSGTCRSDPQVRWFFNSITTSCDWFYDKSCLAGANYFASKHDCVAACGLLISNFAH